MLHGKIMRNKRIARVERIGHWADLTAATIDNWRKWWLLLLLLLLLCGKVFTFSKCSFCFGVHCRVSWVFVCPRGCMWPLGLMVKWEMRVSPRRAEEERETRRESEAPGERAPGERERGHRPKECTSGEATGEEQSAWVGEPVKIAVSHADHSSASISETEEEEE